MKELFQQIGDAIQGFKAKCNTILKNLPPIEQQSAASEIGWAVRNITSAVEAASQLVDATEARIKEFAAQAESAIQARAQELAVSLAETKAAELLQAKLTSGEYLKKEDADAAATARAQNREKEVRQEIATLATRRAEVAALIPAEAAARMSDAQLLDPNYKDNAGQIKARLKRLDELGIKSATLTSEIAALSLDAAGTTEFESRLKMIEEISGSRRAPGASAPAPLALPGATQDSDAPAFV